MTRDEAQLEAQLEQLRALTRAVVQDLGPGAEYLAEPGVVRISRFDRDEEGADRFAWLHTPLGKSGVPLADGWPAAVVQIASNLSDEAVEFGPAFGSPIPACGRHGTHPMNPEVVDAGAVWCCSVDGEVVRPVVLGPGFDDL